jgi:prepilin-type processing-associated H-X9-DG protein
MQYDYGQVSSSSSPYGIPIGKDGKESNPNRLVASTPLPVYTCPSDLPPPRVSDLPFVTANAYERYNACRSNYLFSTGYYKDYDPPYDQTDVRLRGVFGNDGAASICDIKDGESNTIAIGESRQLHTSAAYGPFWGAGTHTAVHGSTRNDNRFVPNYPYGKCAGSSTSKCQYAWGFGSWHAHTTNFLFCDGTVRSIADGMTISVFHSLATPHGGETIELAAD